MLEFCAGPYRPRNVIPSALADLAFNDPRSHRNTKSQRMILLRNSQMFLCPAEPQLLWNDTLVVNDAREKPFIASANIMNPHNSRRICVFREYRSPKQPPSKPFRMTLLQNGKSKCPGMILLQKKWGEGAFARKSWTSGAFARSTKSAALSVPNHSSPRKSWTSGAFARQRV
jgi:hypothetical protein